MSETDRCGWRPMYRPLMRRGMLECAGPQGQAGPLRSA